MVKFFQCAYHPSQRITNFCRAKSCLLPVCSSCIKLHMQNHLIDHNSPEYETIQQMLMEAQKSYSLRLAQIQELMAELINIENTKRQNQNLLKSKFVQFKDKMVREFQRFMKNLEDEILFQFTKEGEKFIENLQEVDQKIQILSESLKTQKQQFETKDGLKLLILYQDRLKDYYLTQIQNFRYQVNLMATESMYMSVNENCLTKLKKCLQSYIKIQKIKWN